MAAGHHHLITSYFSLLELGLDPHQSGLISHFASVYADGMNSVTIGICRAAGIAYYPNCSNVINEFLVKYDASNEDYDIDDLTQSLNDNFQIWHCTRNVNSAYTAQQRILQTGEFAWGKIFEASKTNKKLNEISIFSNEIKALGQALHAFQDICIHQGCKYDTISNKNEHNTIVDMWPNGAFLAQMRNVSLNAIKLYKVNTNDGIDALVGRTINTCWMEPHIISWMNNHPRLQLKDSNNYLII